ncbi:hypothetical protein BpHYR1_024633 [Brachionus plicatilis]|uniref:Uncharacterized protein n=1 Tax=Brachionus plicatilis TaxID=10195 RepID=A0A3M7SGZ8_BRAPC|nr:hypothetical protein BpHYR1_024633 [Brachionus plicatilis]
MNELSTAMEHKLSLSANESVTMATNAITNVPTSAQFCSDTKKENLSTSTTCSSFLTRLTEMQTRMTEDKLDSKLARSSFTFLCDANVDNWLVYKANKIKNNKYKKGAPRYKPPFELEQLFSGLVLEQRLLARPSHQHQWMLLQVLARRLQAFPQFVLKHGNQLRVFFLDRKLSYLLPKCHIYDVDLVVHSISRIHIDQLVPIFVLQQHLDHLSVSPADRNVQTIFVLLCQNVYGCALGKQQLDKLIGALVARYVQWILALSLHLVALYYRILGYEYFADLEKAQSAAEFQGRVGLFVLGVQLDFVLKQQIDNAQVSIGRCQVQRCVASAVHLLNQIA